MTVEQIAVHLLGLSARERAILAEKLIASLEEDSGDGVEALWVEEGERRLRQAEEGAVSLRAADGVLQEARSRLKK